MKRVCIDMDETIADAASEYLARYNAKFGASLSRADLLGRNIYQVVPAEHAEHIKNFFHADDFFVDLAVFPDSQQVIAALAKQYEVYIASAAMEFPESLLPKFRWLERHFPFLDPMNFIFCGDKGILNADYLIDDHVGHFRHFRGEGLLFSAPHNHGIEGYRRMNSWAEVEAYLLPAV